MIMYKKNPMVLIFCPSTNNYIFNIVAVSVTEDIDHIQFVAPF